MQTVEKVDQVVKNQKLTYIYLILSCVLICFASYTENRSLYMLFVLFFSMVGLFVDPLIPLCIHVAVAPMALSLPTSVALFRIALIALPAFYHYAFDEQHKIKTDEFALIILSLIAFMISYMFGIDAQLSTALIQVFVIIQYVMICNIYSKDGNSLLVLTLMLAGFCISFVVLLQLFTGTAVFLWGTRLTYKSSVRALSTAMSFPIFYLSCYFMMPKRRKYSMPKQLAMLIVLLILVVLLILTYSRGVILSVLIAGAYILFKRLGARSVKSYMIYFVLLMAVFLVLRSVEIDTKMMFDALGGGNGRLKIWTFYFDKLFECGWQNVLFGFGPGDILRISQGTEFQDMYAHSAILDYFFSYGLVGFSIFIYMLLRAFCQACAAKNDFVMGLLILTVCLYATHNNCASEEMHILIALVYSMSCEVISKQESPDSINGIKYIR